MIQRGRGQRSVCQCGAAVLKSTPLQKRLKMKAVSSPVAPPGGATERSHYKTSISFKVTMKFDPKSQKSSNECTV